MRPAQVRGGNTGRDGVRSPGMAKIRALLRLSVTALGAALCSPILACSTPSPAPATSTSEAGSPPGPASAPETGSGMTSEGTPEGAAEGTVVTIHLIALDGQPSWQRAKGATGAEIIGCNDYLVPAAVKVRGESP